jgi:tetratricopeptide (TPR) repeat protein
MISNLTPVEYFRIGSGWGALERRRREYFSEKPLENEGFEFNEDSLTELQKPWLTLLESGEFPEMDAYSHFGSFVNCDLWGPLIENSLKKLAANNWFAWYQAGISRYQAGNWVGAEEAWIRSLAVNWSPWAARNLAVLAWKRGQINQAADLLVEASNSAPDVLPLAIECGACLIRAGRYEDWLYIAEGLPQSLQSNTRIRLLRAQAALELGDLVNVEEFFNEGGVVADLREGETSITDLWIEYQVQILCQEENLEEDAPEVIQFRENPPLPVEIDFRMRV